MIKAEIERGQIDQTADSGRQRSDLVLAQAELLEAREILDVGMDLADAIEAQVEARERRERVDELGYLGEPVVTDVQELELVQVRQALRQCRQRVLVQR